jgi:hypothetical protein
MPRVTFGVVVLEQPAGDVLRLLIARGRRGTCSHSRPDVLRAAIAQLESWGFARFEEDATCPGVYRYRVTRLGEAADRWGTIARVVSQR